MRWLVTTMIVLVLLSSTAIAVMGPPMTDLKQGQWEYGFSFSKFNLDEFDVTQRSVLNGQIEYEEIYTRRGDKIFPIKGDNEYYIYGSDYVLTTIETETLPTEITKLKIKSKGFNTTSYLGRMGVGATKNLSIDFYLGGSELDPSGALKHETGYAGGLGLRMNLYQKDKLTVGTSVQWLSASWSDDLDVNSGWNVDRAEWDMRYRELKFLIGPTYQLTNQCIVYGGPCYNIMREIGRAHV